MRNDIAESANWRLGRDRSGSKRAIRSGEPETEREKISAGLSVNAVDAAFEEPPLREQSAEVAAGEVSNSQSDEARELVQSLEFQLVHLEAQCQNLRRLLENV